MASQSLSIARRTWTLRVSNTPTSLLFSIFSAVSDIWKNVDSCSESRFAVVRSEHQGPPFVGFDSFALVYPAIQRLRNASGFRLNERRLTILSQLTVARNKVDPRKILRRSATATSARFLLGEPRCAAASLAKDAFDGTDCSRAAPCRPPPQVVSADSIAIL
jgi:hypothetical protein